MSPRRTRRPPWSPRIASLAMPDDDELAAAAAAVVDDAPPTLPAELDTGAVVERGFGAADRMAVADWDIERLADALDYDAARAFAFVRDRIGFDSVSGHPAGCRGDARCARRECLGPRAPARRTARAHGGAGPIRHGAPGRHHVHGSPGPRLHLAAEPLPTGEVLALMPVRAETLAVRARRDYARLREALGD